MLLVQRNESFCTNQISNHLWLKLHFPGILLQHKCRHNASTPYVKPAPCGRCGMKEHLNSYTQPLINLVSVHILAPVRLCLFYTILSSFFLLCLFYKIKTEEHSNLHNATLLRLFRFYVVGENSRIFQDFIAEFKDFSRIFGNQGLFKDLL